MATHPLSDVPAVAYIDLAAIAPARQAREADTPSGDRCDKPLDKPLDKPSDKPLNKPLGKSIGKPFVQPLDQLLVEPFGRLEKRLRRAVGQAVTEFDMIAEGDRVMVCLSGGKDSYAMLDLLLHLQRVAPIRFEIVAVNLDQKQPGFPDDILPGYLSALGVDYRIIEEDTYSIVRDRIPLGRTTCGLCSRLRRGILYRVAEELGANRIALGHHADDRLETLLLNLFHGGSIKSMPPKLHADDGRNVVIRPLAHCRERDLVAYAAHRAYPIIPCDLCGSQPNLQRQAMKSLIAGWEQDDPSRIRSMLTAIGNVVPSHLADQNLFDFNANARIGAVKN